MITVFWDWTGVVLVDFLEHGDTINSARYVDTLRKLRARVARVRPGLQAILQHDNARPHTSRETQAGLQALRFNDILPHPPYSPDLLPMIFSSSPGSRSISRGRDSVGMLRSRQQYVSGAACSRQIFSPTGYDNSCIVGAFAWTKRVIMSRSEHCARRTRYQATSL